MVALAKKQPLDFDELLNRAKEELLEQVSWEENASGSFLYYNGEIEVRCGYVCHAFLSKDPGVKFIVSGLQDGENYGDNPGRILPKEVELWYLDYILNRSPYSETFLTKDAEKALEERLVVSTTNHPGCLVGGAIVSLRRLWEHVYVARSAYDLVQAGVNEDLAFILGHCIQSPSEVEPDTKVSWEGCHSWHTSIDPGVMGFKEIKNFMNRELVHKTSTYHETGGYRGYSNMYGGNLRDSIVSVLTTFPYNKCVEEVVKDSDKNPFSKAKLAVDKANQRTPRYAKAIEVMAEWAKTYLMEKINAA